MTPEDDIQHRMRIAMAALDWRGTPYRHQASAKGHGTDCLGLVRGVWREVIGPEPMEVPPYTADWRTGGEVLLDVATTYLHASTEPEPALADVLLFRMRSTGPARHCGIYIGHGRFLHAYDGRAVAASWFSNYWRRRLVGCFSFPTQKNGGHA